MQVRALENGFFGGSLRRAGTTFDVPDGTKAKWFAPIEEYKPTAAAQKAEKATKQPKPQALSELAKGSAPKSQIDVLSGASEDSIA